MLLTARSRASSRTLYGAHKRRLKPAITKIASLAMTWFTEYLLNEFFLDLQAIAGGPEYLEMDNPVLVSFLKQATYLATR